MAEMFGLVRDGLSYIVPFVFVLTMVVFFHELGHFIVARWCGVRVLAFSIGFGPELVSWHDRSGTRWRIAALPLGGYVRFFGDEGAASTPDREGVAAMGPADRGASFHGKSVARRAAIVVAGPVANFILAMVIFTAVFWIMGEKTVAPKVDSVQPNSAAVAAGIAPGDEVLSVAGTKVDAFNDMQRLIAPNAGRQIDIVVRRDGRELTLRATPHPEVRKDIAGDRRTVGVLGIRGGSDPGDVRTVSYGPIGALRRGAAQTWEVVARTMEYLGGVASGRQSTDQLSGPLRIAEVSGEAAKLGFQVLMNLAAVLSVSIGLLNLFPVPLLDGGHLLYFAIEALRGRPLSDRVQEYGFRIGLVLVAMLMLVATWNDIVHLTTL